MKNPLRKIRWHRFAFHFTKHTIRVGILFVVAVLAILVSFDLYCEVQGLPGWATDMVRAELSRRGVRGEFREIRAGLLTSIVVEDAALSTSRQGIEFTLQADQIRARLGYHALLSRQPFLQTLDISGGSLHCDSPDRDAVLPYIGDLQADLRPRAGGAYAINMRGLFEGVSLRLSGRIRNAEALWGPQPEPSDEAQRLPELLETITTTFRQCRFGSGDATLEATVDLDAEDWQEYAVMGNWNIANLMFRGMLAQTCKGQFTVSPRQSVFRDVTVRLNRDEYVVGKVVLEPAKRRFWAEGEGRTTLGTVYHLAGSDHPEWVRRFGLTTPVGFKTVFHPAPWDNSAKWHVELACEADGFALRDLPVRRFQARAEIVDRIVRIPSFTWDVSGEQTGEKVDGSATIWPVDGEFALELEGAVDWRLRSRQLGFRLPPPVMRLDTGAAPPRFRLALDRSPYAVDQWHGSASLRADQLAYGRVRGGAMEADIRFGGETVRVDSFRLAFGLPGTSLSGDLDILLPAAEQPRLQIGYDLAVRQNLPPAPPELAAFTGSVVWDAVAETLAVQGEGTAAPDRAIRALGLPEEEHVSLVKCAGPPLRIRFSLPATGDNLRDWRIKADVEGEDVIYDDLRFKEVATTMDISPREISLNSLRGRTVADDVFRLNLAIAFRPLTVRVTDGDLRGDPRLVATFIEDRGAQQNYRRIWQGLEWDTAHLPHFQLPSLSYRQQNRNWRLEMRATGEAEEVTFQGVSVQNLTLGARLDLPGTIEVNHIRLAVDGTVLKGEVKVLTDGVPRCDLHIATEEGGCDPRMVLRLANPEIDEYLGTMEFSPDSAVTCNGSFLLAREPRLNLTGTLRAPSWQWSKVKLADVTAEWGVRDSEIRWDIERASFCQGTVASTGTYDTVRRAGVLAVELNGASLNAIVADFGTGQTTPEHDPKVALSGRVHFLREWAGRPVQLTGGGQLDVTEGDLWRVPVLSQLGALLDLPLLHRISRGNATGLGQISALRADLIFDGERVSVPHFFTDGTVISLSGTGEYSWRTDRLEFDVVGEAFRQMGGLVSFVTSPISWVFNARLSGTSKEYRWRMNNALKRALLGEEDSEKRRLGTP
jgi:hypothetical protein